MCNQHVLFKSSETIMRYIVLIYAPGHRAGALYFLLCGGPVATSSSLLTIILIIGDTSID